MLHVIRCFYAYDDRHSNLMLLLYVTFNTILKYNATKHMTFFYKKINIIGFLKLPVFIPYHFLSKLILILVIYINIKVIIHSSAWLVGVI